MTKIFFAFLLITLVFAHRVAKAAGTIERLGDVFTIAIPAYAFGLASREPDWDGMIEFAESHGAAMITTSLLQPAIGEQRPNGHSNGFPSGHATSAFSGAMFIHKRYGFSRALVPYLLAGFTGYSRVQSKWHYTHDVIAGAAVAAFWTWIFVDDKEDAYNFYVQADSSGAAVRADVRF